MVESECRCWNPTLWVLVSLLGTLVLVAVSMLLRLGEYMLDIRVTTNVTKGHCSYFHMHL